MMTSPHIMLSSHHRIHRIVELKLYVLVRGVFPGNFPHIWCCIHGDMVKEQAAHCGGAKYTVLGCEMSTIRE